VFKWLRRELLLLEERAGVRHYKVELNSPAHLMDIAAPSKGFLLVISVESVKSILIYL
jgi:hypothetical protein